MCEFEKHLPNAFAIATFPRTAMTGTSTIELPNSLHISTNDKVLLPILVENGGGPKSGKPGRTAPVSKNGEPSPEVS